MTGKTIIGVVWIYTALCLFLPLPLAGIGVYVFWLMLAAHVVECFVFREKLKAAPGGLGHNVVQTMLFGVLHVNTLPDPAEDAV